MIGVKVLKTSGMGAKGYAVGRQRRDTHTRLSGQIGDAWVLAAGGNRWVGRKVSPVWAQRTVIIRPAVHPPRIFSAKAWATEIGPGKWAVVARAPCCGVSLGFSDWWTGLDLGDGGAALPRDNIRRVGLIDSSLSSTLAPSSRGESSC